MSGIRSKLSELYSLERLASNHTCIHSLHPLAKLLATVVYIIALVSFDRYAVLRLIPYAVYPILLMPLAEAPFKMIAKRTLVALPFCLFAGLSNLLLDRQAFLQLGSLSISYGAASCCSVLIRTPLCVSAVLLLVAATPFAELTAQLRRMHVPAILVSLFEMTYRYLGTLLEEASSMFTAYRLRSRSGKGLEMKHMGSFVGQLLIRSFARAERVYQAMKCRGYGLAERDRDRRPMTMPDYVFLAAVCVPALLFRLADVPQLLGRMFSCWM